MYGKQGSYQLRITLCYVLNLSELRRQHAFAGLQRRGLELFKLGISVATVGA